MRILVCYDISDNRRREDLVRILLDYGQRVQESVFWLEAEEELLERMKGRIEKVLEEREDSVWLVPVCDGCAKKVVTVGVQRVPEIPEYYIL